MQAWTQASFDAVATYDDDLDERVVWLTLEDQRSGLPDGSAGSEFLRRCAGKIGRVGTALGVGCLATALAPDSALAPVSQALASVERIIEAPVSTEIMPAPHIAASIEADIQLDAARGEAEEFLRFGSRSLPRTLVDTILRAARATSVDPIYLMALADKESSFRTDVQASTSSAKGLFQFIDRTWLETVRGFGAKHGLAAEAAAIDLVDERPVVTDEARRAAILDLRADPYVAAVMAAEMLKRDAGLIGFRIGRELKPTEMYLAHFFGLEDAARFIQMRGARRPASATRAFPAAAKANIGIFFEQKRRGRRGLSVPEVYARLDHMIDSRLSRYRSVARYASEVAGV